MNCLDPTSDVILNHVNSAATGLLWAKEMINIDKQQLFFTKEYVIMLLFAQARPTKRQNTLWLPYSSYQ